MQTKCLRFTLINNFKKYAINPCLKYLTADVYWKAVHPLFIFRGNERIGKPNLSPPDLFIIIHLLKSFFKKK